MPARVAPSHAAPCTLRWTAASRLVGLAVTPWACLTVSRCAPPPNALQEEFAELQVVVPAEYNLKQDDLPSTLPMSSQPSQDLSGHVDITAPYVPSHRAFPGHATHAAAEVLPGGENGVDGGQGVHTPEALYVPSVRTTSLGRPEQSWSTVSPHNCSQGTQGERGRGNQ